MAILENILGNLKGIRESLAKLDETRLPKDKEISFLFSKRKDSYNASRIESSMTKAEDNIWALSSYTGTKPDKDKLLRSLNIISEAKKYFSEGITKRTIKKIEELEKELSTIRIIEKPKQSFTIPKLKNIPLAVRDELTADYKELRACFESGLFRSSIIFCGRILEVALHRRYYELTKKDILETQPGIGLGKLVAKLYEKKALFDPGINEQIHLINKVRIQSVHKKQTLFIASREQTYATILYTIDIVNRLFP